MSRKSTCSETLSWEEALETAGGSLQPAGSPLPPAPDHPKARGQCTGEGLLGLRGPVEITEREWMCCPVPALQGAHQAGTEDWAGWGLALLGTQPPAARPTLSFSTQRGFTPSLPLPLSPDTVTDTCSCLPQQPGPPQGQPIPATPRTGSAVPEPETTCALAVRGPCLLTARGRRLTRSVGRSQESGPTLLPPTA